MRTDMRKVTGWLSLAVMLALVAGTPVARADEGDSKVMMDRLERLENQVQHLSTMREPSMARFGRPEDPRGPMAARAMMEAPKAPVPPTPPACPPMNTPGAARCLRCVGHTLILVLAIVHILLAGWVYGDVQKRGVSGRGIFIVLVLLAGIPMSILYALVRIGDRCGEKPA